MGKVLIMGQPYLLLDEEGMERLKRWQDEEKCYRALYGDLFDVVEHYKKSRD